MSNKEQMLAMMEESFGNIKKGEIVEGTVVGIDESNVVVDIGYKSEGVISLSEFSDDVPEVGQQINVYIVYMEDATGRVKLSKKVAEKEEIFQNLVKAHENGDVVEFQVKKLVNGGFFVTVNGCNAFLPGSLVDIKPVKNFKHYLDQTLEGKIINIDKAKKSIVVSRKDSLLDVQNKKKLEVFENLGEGAEVDGVVKGITDYGAFVDIGGFDGLLHISDMSWSNISHPSVLFKVGDKIRVKILKIASDTNRISLGVKQLLPHPWENVDQKISQGDTVKGVVTKLTSYGAFVDLEVGLKGFIHKSEMSWTRTINHPGQVLSEGEEISAIVLNIDKEDKKISLGLRQMTINPWLTIEMKYEVGQVVTRPVKSITSFGMFLELDDDIDGLVHIADVAWSRRIDNLKSVYRVGQEVEVKILDIDTSAYKVSFGIKQLTENPWEKAELLKNGQEVKAKVQKTVQNKGVVLDLEYEGLVFEGFVPFSYVSLDQGQSLSEKYPEGSEHDFLVSKVDRKGCRIILKPADQAYESRNQDEDGPVESFHEQLDNLNLD